MAPRIPQASTSVFEPVRQDRNFEIVVQRVRDKLMGGELRPGDKLPAERELSKQLNVSRNVVREALRILESAGLVQTRKGAHGGAFVAPGSSTQMTQVLGDLILLNAIELDDLFEARTMLLEMILNRIAQLEKPLDLGPLKETIEETRVAVAENDSTRRVVAARNFYHQIAAMTGNTALVFTVDAQTELVQTFLRFRVSDMDPDRLLTSRQAFVDLLEQGRIDEAKEELRNHLDRVHRSLWKKNI